MRRHLTYANIVATLALLFAMSGGALAAKHYLLTSTKQIKPSVLKKLRGNIGPRGATGPAGPAGAKGEAGADGPSGSSAGTPVVQGSTAVIFTDPGTGLQVSQTGSGSFSFHFTNTNSKDSITVNGVVETLGEALFPVQRTLGPGESLTTPSNAAQTRYVDVAVVRGGETFASSPILHVTCGVADNGAAPANCITAH